MARVQHHRLVGRHRRAAALRHGARPRPWPAPPAARVRRWVRVPSRTARRAAARRCRRHRAGRRCGSWPRAAPGARPGRPRWHAGGRRAGRTGGPGGGCRRLRRCGGGSRGWAIAHGLALWQRAAGAAGHAEWPAPCAAPTCSPCSLSLALVSWLALAGGAGRGADAGHPLGAVGPRRRRRLPRRCRHAGRWRCPTNGRARGPGFGGTLWYRVRFERLGRARQRRPAGAVRRACLQQPGGASQRPAGAQRGPHERPHHPQLQPPAAGGPAFGAAPAGREPARHQGRRPCAWREVGSRQRAGGLSALSIGPQSLLATRHARATALQVTAPQAVSATLLLMGGFMFVLGFINRRESHLAYFGALSVGWALIDMPAVAARRCRSATRRPSSWSSRCSASSTWAAVQFLLRYAGVRHRRVDTLLPLQCALLPLSLVVAGPAAPACGGQRLVRRAGAGGGGGGASGTCTTNGAQRNAVADGHDAGGGGLGRRHRIRRAVDGHAAAGRARGATGGAGHLRARRACAWCSSTATRCTSPNRTGCNWNSACARPPPRSSTTSASWPSCAWSRSPSANASASPPTCTTTWAPSC